MILQTERLLLRPIETGDAAEIFAYSREPNIGPNAGWKPHENLAQTRAILEAIFVGAEGVFGAQDRASGKLIGSLGLIRDPKRENARTRMLGYALSEAYWGRGLMTEAVSALLAHGFGAMQLDLISAYCYPHNARSRNLLKKCGFAYEGTLALCETLFDGTVQGNECYALKNPALQG